jgi:hypothetical protein
LEEETTLKVADDRMLDMFAKQGHNYHILKNYDRATKYTEKAKDLAIALGKSKLVVGLSERLVTCYKNIDQSQLVIKELEFLVSEFKEGRKT